MKIIDHFAKEMHMVHPKVTRLCTTTLQDHKKTYPKILQTFSDQTASWWTDCNVFNQWKNIETEWSFCITNLQDNKIAKVYEKSV